jgi:hypothetical protein
VADVGCAVGSGSEIALSNSDVALLGSDLHGVPGAIGIARATSSVIFQNFGWAMGYNLSALPLAAAGLLDPLIAALATGVSSLVVVLNSLRLMRLGRGGIATIRPPAVLRGARGFVASILIPIALFGGGTALAQVFSPARGQPLLPTLPGITTVTLPDGVSTEVYLANSSAGVNAFHIIFSSPAGVTIGVPRVIASSARAGSMTLRIERVSFEHYSAVTELTPGTWHFRVQVPEAGRDRTFVIERVLS